MGKDLEQSTRNTTIKAIRMASSLPDNFVVSADNTVSDENSYNPIYIFFDNTDDAGIIYFYTPARKIHMNEYSGVMFGNLNALADITGVSNWDTSMVTDMYGMFNKNLPNSTSQIPATIDLNPLANWDTSSVTNMAGMFASDVSLNNISVLSSWDTQSVEDMSSMFYYNTSLTDISALSNWNISSVTIMGYMFYGVNNIDATVLNGWNVSNVTNKYSMFTCPADKRPNWY